MKLKGAKLKDERVLYFENNIRFCVHFKRTVALGKLTGLVNGWKRVGRDEAPGVIGRRESRWVWGEQEGFSTGQSSFNMLGGAQLGGASPWGSSWVI